MNILDNYEIIEYEKGQPDKYGHKLPSILPLTSLFVTSFESHKRKVTYINGIIHSIHDNPAVIIYGDDNHCIKIWYQNGIIARNNNYSIYLSYINSQEWYWYTNLTLHRDQRNDDYTLLPAMICIYNDLIHNRYYINGNRVDMFGKLI